MILDSRYEPSRNLQSTCVPTSSGSLTYEMSSHEPGLGGKRCWSSGNQVCCSKSREPCMCRTSPNAARAVLLSPFSDLTATSTAGDFELRCARSLTDLAGSVGSSLGLTFLLPLVA